MRKVIRTEDGSNTIYDDELLETYHSTHGAIQESRHVFINAALAQANQPEIRILEVGFGTGLNALLAMEYALQQNSSIEMTSIESDPLDAKLITRLNYPDHLDHENGRMLFDWIHSQPWNTAAIFNARFSLCKERADWHSYKPTEDYYTIVFYDAFAPSKQIDMWSLNCIEKACNSLQKGGIFVTYSARGQLKRDLANAGMEVETLSGPPGKKEMVRAVKS
jgi:tRNA U34 5-methylaminomethyl-2-thiouridine-forming methyltransferase MnmC